MVRSSHFAPLMRSTIGFDHLNRLFDTATRLDPSESSYPPYNIEKTDDDHYRITMAVAGFKENELDVVTQENVLYIRGKAESSGEDTEYLHRGIAKRAFERRFQLADTIKAVSATVENGLLHVDLLREVPEAQKPRQIPIATVDGDSKEVQHKAA